MGWVSVTVEAVGGGPREPMDELDHISSSSWNTWNHTDQKPRDCGMQNTIAYVWGIVLPEVAAQ